MPEDSLYTDSEVQQAIATVARLFNTQQSGIVTVPAHMQAGLVVPVVSGLKATVLGSTASSTQIVLTWIEPEEQKDLIDSYNIYCTNQVSSTGKPDLIGSTVKSPAVFHILAAAASTLVFTVQTSMKNGAVSEFSASPSTTAVALDPTTTAAAAGSTYDVQYNSGGNLAAYTSKFTFNPSNGRLFVGTTALPTPGSYVFNYGVGSFTVYDNVNAANYFVMVHDGAAANSTGFVNYSFSGSDTNNGAIFAGYNGRGTLASPNYPQSGDRLFALWGGGYTGNSGVDTVRQAAVEATAGSTWSTTNGEAYLTFVATASGSVSPATVAWITSKGIGIGGAPTSPLRVKNLPVYANNAAAITGGLAVGDCYRTGADPDPVCVVH